MSSSIVLTVGWDPHHHEGLSVTFQSQNAILLQRQSQVARPQLPGCLSPALLLCCGAAAATGCTAAAGVSQLKKTSEIYCMGMFS